MQKKKSLLVPILMWLLAAGGAAVLFYFSGQDGVRSGELSSRVARIILRILPGTGVEFDLLHFYVRKLAHFGIFAVEGALLCGALIATLRRVWISALLSAAICVPMAALNEFHQFFMDGRSCELRDMIIDSAGALGGILLVSAIAWCIRRRKNVII